VPGAGTLILNLYAAFSIPINSFRKPVSFRITKEKLSLNLRTIAHNE